MPDILIAAPERSGTHLVMHLVASVLGLQQDHWEDIPWGTDIPSARKWMARTARTRRGFSQPEIWKTHHGVELLPDNTSWPKVIYVWRDVLDTLTSQWVFLHRRAELRNVDLRTYCLGMDPDDEPRQEMSIMDPRPSNMVERLVRHQQGWLGSYAFNVKYGEILNSHTAGLRKYLTGVETPIQVPRRLVGVTPWRGLIGSHRELMDEELKADVLGECKRWLS